MQQEWISKIVADRVRDILPASTAYQHNKVSAWTQTIIESILAQLTTAKHASDARTAKIRTFWANAKITTTVDAVAEENTDGNTTAADNKQQYKYIVTCVIMQKPSQTGMHAASSCFWDSERDGSFVYRHDTKSVHCLVNVFAVSL